MLKDFENWLLSKRYKPNTSIDYASRLERLCRKENFTIEYLAKHLSEIMPLYDKSGKKSCYGRLSHCTVLNALRRFSEFLDESAY